MDVFSAALFAVGLFLVVIQIPIALAGESGVWKRMGIDPQMFFASIVTGSFGFGLAIAGLAGMLVFG